MERLPTPFRYWFLEILPRAFREALPTDKLKDKVTEIFVSLFAGFLFILAIGTIDPSVGVGINAVTLILVFLATFFLRLVTSSILLPAKIFKEQGGFIENPFVISPASYLKFSPTNEDWIGLKVENKTKIANIENCRLMLMESLELQNNIPTPFDPPVRLVWSGLGVKNNREIPDYMTIQFDEPQACDIAIAIPNQHRAIFNTAFARGSELFSVIPGRYRLKIMVLDTWKGHPISYMFIVDICFGVDWKLQIENVEQIKE